MLPHLWPQLPAAMTAAQLLQARQQQAVLECWGVTQRSLLLPLLLSLLLLHVLLCMAVLCSLLPAACHALAHGLHLQQRQPPLLMAHLPVLARQLHCHYQPSLPPPLL
jgi:uncharacterized BrkB/YihY/UPF0761 family membrane protein